MFTIFASTPFTRPADTTQYTQGDLIANSTTANLVVPINIALGTTAPLGVLPFKAPTGRVMRVRLKKSSPVLTNAVFRVHLYRRKPTVTNGDNGVWLSIEGGWLGSFDVTVDKAFSDAAEGVGLPTVGTSVAFTLPGQEVRAYMLLEARGATGYTPVSGEIFTIYAETEIPDVLPAC